MDLFNAIQKRRSIRKYLEKPVEFEKVSLMLEAASLAPCAGNLQHWKYVIITEKKQIKRLSEVSYDQFWIGTAPLIIAVCSNCEKQETHYGKRGKELFSIQSVAASIENMLLMATALDLGTCWVGAFDDQRVRDILEVPTNINVHALITVGYADEKPGKRNLNPLESCVSFNKYGMPVKNLNLLLKDYCEEFARLAEEAEPKVNALLEKLKKIKDDVLGKKQK
jgi:nitroreductase